MTDNLGAPDYDSPWKEAIDAFFQPFMALFFPSVHALIDWNRPYEFLDAELQRITGDSTIGRRYADRLVKVHSREGLEVWLLLHIEIQGQADAQFPERMFQYWYRIYDRFGGVETISLALLTNDRSDGEIGEYRSVRSRRSDQAAALHRLADPPAARARTGAAARTG